MWRQTRHIFKTRRRRYGAYRGISPQPPLDKAKIRQGIHGSRTRNVQRHNSFGSFRTRVLQDLPSITTMVACQPATQHWIVHVKKGCVVWLTICGRGGGLSRLGGEHPARSRNSGPQRNTLHSGTASQHLRLPRYTCTIVRPNPIKQALAMFRYRLQQRATLSSGSASTAVMNLPVLVRIQQHWQAQGVQ